jgi:hypothetical protein
MAGQEFGRWQQDFREAAKADGCAILRDHLHGLGLPNNPELLLEGTIHLVQACLSYAILDHQSYARFLGMQKYDPAEAADAMYAVTFDLCGKAFGRVLVPPSAGDSASQQGFVFDLADLYGHSWQCYKRVGYDRFWVSRIDGDDLAREELAEIELVVTYDLRFDYDEEELDIWFDDLSTEGSLLVTVQDRHDSEEELPEQLPAAPQP